MFQKAKYPTSTTSGNEGSGGANFNLGIAVYKEIKDLEIQLIVNRNFQTLQH
jgi:hypothetical protein